MRGVESFGMLCAEDEIGISNDHGGIMVLTTRSPGTPFVSLGYYDTTFEVNDVTPEPPGRPFAPRRRARTRRQVQPSAQASSTRSPKIPQKPPRYQARSRTGLRLPCYVGRVIRDVKVGPSPEWLSKPSAPWE